jgi:hypothetical protein
VSSSTELSDQKPSDNRDGYCRPPEATRFRKGQSGNPQGRAKGTLNVATVLTKTLREKVVINENGQRKTVTKLEAAIKQLVNQAASGNLRALRPLVELSRDAEAKQNAGEMQNAVVGELDQEVIEGIMKRFQEAEQQVQEPQEVGNGDDQSG